MQNTQQTLYLIDGHSYIYRAFYAIKGLRTSGGMPSNAIFGFTNMLLKLCKEKEPDFIAVAFDPPGPTERSKQFEDYKAKRPSMPEELVVQLPFIKKIVNGFNIEAFEIPGIEADDVIAAVVKLAEQKDISVVLVTADKDLNQLLSDNVRAFDPMKNKITEADDIMTRYGLPPHRLKEIMALTGDKIDNIPGVPGIGEKTAVSLIKEFGSLDNLIKEHQKIKRTKLRKAVNEHLDNIRLSLELVTLNPDVPLEVKLDDLKAREPDWEALIPVFRECEFNQLMKLVPNINNSTEFKLIKDKKDFPTGQTRFSFTVALIDAQSNSDELAGIAFKTESENSLYLSLVNEDDDSDFPKSEKMTALKSLFEDKEVSKVTHDLKKAIRILKHNGIELSGNLFDTMISSYLLNPNKGNHDIESVSLDYLEFKLPDQDAPLQEAACARVEAISRLYPVMSSQLEENGLNSLFNEVEMPLVSVLASMEKNGIMVKTEELASISHELEKSLASIEENIYTLAGESFNINSPKQLQDVLFNKLGLQPIKKTKTGYSTNVDVLQTLSASHPLPGAILEHRSLFKLKNTYVDTLPEFINPETGRIHPKFNQTITSTGRLSSSEPNLQNIPIKGPWAKQIRSAFAAENGFVLLSSDYSQIELRILAHLSQDQGLIHAFQQDLDIHSATASELFGVELNQVNHEMRRKAKTVNFGIIYGISPYGLSQQLGISTKESEQYIKKFFEFKKGVQEYIESVKSRAKEKGYVTTIFGRRRDVPEIQSPNKTVMQQGERLAINTPIQGTSADIIKIAMVNISKRLQKDNHDIKMLLQVHDALLCEVKEGDIEKAKDLIRQEMEGAADLIVPLKVNIGYGKNWAIAES